MMKQERADVDGDLRHMRAIQPVYIVVFMIALMCLSACSSAPMTRHEADDWYTTNAPELTWVGYQGTDDKYHHFVGRTEHGWDFIRIKKGELTVEDERPFTSIYRYPLYYYQVDPKANFAKIEGTEPD